VRPPVAEFRYTRTVFAVLLAFPNWKVASKVCPDLALNVMLLVTLPQLEVFMRYVLSTPLATVRLMSPVNVQFVRPLLKSPFLVSLGGRVGVTLGRAVAVAGGWVAVGGTRVGVALAGGGVRVGVAP
jgi:hypothetical protein